MWYSELTEQEKQTEARAQLMIAVQQWKLYADIMDAHYIGADMQRNFHFQSWHQLDPEVLSDLTDAGGPKVVDFGKPFPWVRIVTPLDLAEIKAPSDITLTVNADDDGQPAKVELLDNGRVIHTSDETSFSHTLSHIDPGDHNVTARVTAPDGATKEHAIRIALFNDQTQNSLPWIETFTHANQTTTDEGRTTWTTTRSKGTFEIRENALFLNDKGDEATLRTGEIDLANRPVTISLDITCQGGVDPSDYVRLYHIVDGGKEQLIGEIKGRDTVPTTLQGTALGQKLILILRAKVSSEDEVFILDNLTVNPQ